MEKHELLPSGVLFAKRIGIFSNIPSKIRTNYIYIYIYKLRSYVEKYDVLPSCIFFLKRIGIFSNATSEIRTN